MAAPSVFFWPVLRNDPYTPYVLRSRTGRRPLEVRARLGDVRIFTHTKAQVGGQNSGLRERVPAPRLGAGSRG